MRTITCSRRGVVGWVMSCAFVALNGICGVGKAFAAPVGSGSSNAVDKSKMRRKYSYSADWLDVLDKTEIEWRFVRRDELDALSNLFSEIPGGTKVNWRDAGDIHCVIRIYRKGGLTANFRSLVLKGKPKDVDDKSVERSFRIYNDTMVPMVWSVHPTFGWGDRARDQTREAYAKALSGDWEFELDDIHIVDPGRYF